MSPLKYLLLIVVLSSCAYAFSASESNLYQLQSQFGDTISCDYITEGIYVVWWDSKNDLTEEAYILLDTMMVYRDLCLETYDFQDPPNPQDGYYFNIYLHENGDVFPDGWSCGVGTDNYGYPYLTLPIPLVLSWNWVTISHEAFHIFQYSSDAPGFDGVDVFWFIEASANWFAALTHLDSSDAFVEAVTLIKVPHVTMWLGYDNYPSYYPENWQRYCHQYAMALFLYYLTEVEEMPSSLITGGFYNGGSSCPQDLNPQEYLFENCTGDLRVHFMNWAAHMANDFDFILPGQVETAWSHWNSYSDPEDDNQFTMVFDDVSSGWWFSPPDSLVTTAWSFNTYKILNEETQTCNLTLQGSEFGSMGDPACFRGKVVIRNTFSDTRFYDLEMESDVYGTIAFDVTPSDTAIYFIVGSLPEVFSGTEQYFQYSISMEPSQSSVEPQTDLNDLPNLAPCSPNPFSGSTEISFSTPSAGPVSLDIYDVSGRRVSNLHIGDLVSGYHQYIWNGSDDSGGKLPSGLYIVNLQCGNATLNRRITILR